MKALSIQEFIDLRDQSRDHYGVALHLHDQCSSQYLSTDGQIIDKDYLTFLTGFLDKGNRGNQCGIYRAVCKIIKYGVCFMKIIVSVVATTGQRAY